jgi:hypothetical protein
MMRRWLLQIVAVWQRQQLGMKVEGWGARPPLACVLAVVTLVHVLKAGTTTVITTGVVIHMMICVMMVVLCICQWLPTLSPR